MTNQEFYSRTAATITKDFHTQTHTSKLIDTEKKPQSANVGLQSQRYYFYADSALCTTSEAVKNHTTIYYGKFMVRNFPNCKQIKNAQVVCIIPYF